MGFRNKWKRIFHLGYGRNSCTNHKVSLFNELFNHGNINQGYMRSLHQSEDILQRTTEPSVGSKGGRQVSLRPSSMLAGRSISQVLPLGYITVIVLSI